MRAEFAGDVSDFALLSARAGGQKHWNVVMRRQSVGLAGDPAASLGVRRGDRSEDREVVRLGQPAAAASNSTERHVHAIIFVYLR